MWVRKQKGDVSNYDDVDSLSEAIEITTWQDWKQSRTLCKTNIFSPLKKYSQYSYGTCFEGLKAELCAGCTKLFLSQLTKPLFPGIVFKCLIKSRQHFYVNDAFVKFMELFCAVLRVVHFITEMVQRLCEKLNKALIWHSLKELFTTNLLLTNKAHCPATPSTSTRQNNVRTSSLTVGCDQHLKSFAFEQSGIS